MRRNPTRRPNDRISRLVAATVVALVPAACASGDVGTRPEARVGAEIAPGESLTGNYLAGRHAHASNDVTAAADYLRAALARDPDNPGLMRRAFSAALLDGRIDEAMALAERLGAIGAKSAVAPLALAIDDLAAGRLQAAEARLDGLGTNAVSRMLGPIMRAWVLQGLERTDEAVAVLEPIERAGRGGLLRRLHAALLADAAGRDAIAEGHYRAALDEQSGRSLRLLLLAGTFLERTGKADEAEAMYRAFVEDNPGTEVLDTALARLAAGEAPPREVAGPAAGVAEALFDVSSALARQNARETALLLGRLGLHLRPDFPVLQMLVADLLEVFDRLEMANDMYASIRPSSNLAWRARLSVAANLNRLDRFDEAASTLRRMAADRDSAEPLIDLGDMLRARERFREAVDAYDGAIERIGDLEPRHWSLLYARGIALERSKIWSRAEADFLKALEFEPDQPYVLNYLGYSWVEQGQNLDRALDMIRRAVSLRPNDGYIVDSLGWVYYRLGRYPEAVRELERAIELRPEDPVINDHLGDAYWTVGRQREARFQWRRALGLDPEPDLVEKLEAKLERGLVREANAVGND